MTTGRFRCLSGVPLGLALGFVLAVGAVPSQGDPLSPREREIARLVDAGESEGLDLLRRAVDINSGTLNLDGVRQVGELFRAELDQLGFETQWIDGSPFGRAGHLLAVREREGRKLLLIGHLDTVFEPDSPFQRYERISQTEARGPGIIDMKGGNVIIVRALKALQAAGVLDSLSIRVVLTGDEEKTGRPLELSRRVLAEAADWADLALGFEDGDGSPHTAVIARRGSTSWTLQVRGTPAHSSQIFQPEFGAGAILETARILDGFRRRLEGKELLTFNPGVALAGTTVDFDPSQSRGSAFGKENVIAEHAVVTGDLRCISPQQLEEARDAMQSVASASLPGTRADLAFSAEGYPPMAPSQGNRLLLGMYDRVSRDLGLGPVTAVDPRKAGAADVSFAADRVEMALDGLGLMGRDGHTVEETADLTTFASQTRRAALLLWRLAQQE